MATCESLSTDPKPDKSDRLTLTRPDDWHVHLRDGPLLDLVARASARTFGRLMAMPNLKPPVTTVDEAEAYRNRILAALGKSSTCLPYMTLYLTSNTSVDTIKGAANHPFILGFKHYPAGATTHSEAGVEDLLACGRFLETLESLDLVLQVHGEVTDPQVDIFDREKIFIERQLIPVMRRHPGLRVVFEHITTREAVDFVREAGPRMGATITPHHLLYDRNALFKGGLRPDFYCLPVLKRENHRIALVNAATSGSQQFFLGSDSAPHLRQAKLSSCGCAGIYSAPLALELYAEVFDTAGALDRLEGFASHHGADFYRLPRARDTLTLIRQPWTAPASDPCDQDAVVPLRAGETIHWQVEHPSC